MVLCQLISNLLLLKMDSYYFPHWDGAMPLVENDILTSTNALKHRSNGEGSELLLRVNLANKKHIYTLKKAQVLPPDQPSPPGDEGRGHRLDTRTPSGSLNQVRPAVWRQQLGLNSSSLGCVDTAVKKQQQQQKRSCCGWGECYGGLTLSWPAVRCLQWLTL